MADELNSPKFTEKFITIDPAQNTQQANYKLLIGSIVPRPIAWVSTRSADGVDNLAPFSFFNGVCSNPPTILFCPTIRGSDGELKDTLRNIQETNEFVVNIVDESLVEKMNLTAAELPFEISEFSQAGLTPAPGVVVKAPRVLESPLSMECRLQQVIPIGDGSVGSGFVVLGTIVQFHIREDIHDNGHVLIDQLKPVSRLAGALYAPIRDVFELARPKMS